MSKFQKDFVSGTFYIGIAKYAGIITQLGVTAILARLLTPEDYGIITIALVFIAFFSVLSDVGVGVAVIQRKDLSEKDLDHLFSLCIYFGIILALIFFFCAQPISKFYSNQSLLNVCRLLSLLVLFTCARIVPMNLLYREKKFKYIAFTNLSVQITCGIAAILAALSGWGVYALVLSQVLSSILLFLIYICKFHCHFYLKIDFAPFKRIFSYSIYNFAGTIFIFFTQNIDKLLVGKYIGTKLLGYYEKSYNLVFLPINNITFVITPVLHPLFSEFQNDFRELGRKYFKIIRYLAFISFPLSVVLFFTAKELILLFYGGQWNEAIAPFRIMSLSVAILILDTTVGSIYNAANQTKRGFYTMLVMSIIMISSIITAIFCWGTIISVAYAFLLARIFTTLINFYSLTKGLNGSFSNFLRCISRPMLIGMILFILMFLFEMLFNINNLFISLVAKCTLWLFLSIFLIQFFGGIDLFGLVKDKIKTLMLKKKR